MRSATLEGMEATLFTVSVAGTLERFKYAVALFMVRAEARRYRVRLGVIAGIPEQYR
jgi:hypothetical protein